jgi:hypothetical protein
MVTGEMEQEAMTHIGYALALHFPCVRPWCSVATPRSIQNSSDEHERV